MLTTTAASANLQAPLQRHCPQKKQQKQQRVKQQNQQLLLFGLTILIGALILAPIGSQALPLTDRAEHSIETKKYCSSNLSDAIRQICGGRYNSLSRQYPESVGYGAIRSLQSLAPEEESYFRPLTNGPIHECCRRPCGYHELKSYCAPID